MYKKLRKIDLICLITMIVQILLIVLALLNSSVIFKIISVLFIPVTLIMIVLSNKKTKSTKVNKTIIAENYEEWEKKFKINILPRLNMNEDIKKVDLVAGEISLFSKEDLLKEQVGYVYDSQKNIINEWIGINYVVIGRDSTCGDSIIMDSSYKQLPIYTMQHDDWSTLKLISNSYDEFLKIMSILQKEKIGINTPLEKRINILNKISIISTNNLDSWKTFLSIDEEK